MFTCAEAFLNYLMDVFTFMCVNSMCFPLGLNLVAFLVIVFSYSSMFFSIYKTGINATDLRSRLHRDVAVANRFFFIVFSDALCWIPIFLVKVLSLSEVEIPGETTTLCLTFCHISFISCLKPLLRKQNIKIYILPRNMHIFFLLFPFRHHLQLGSDLHPSHQQRLEPHPVHLNHQLLQRAGGTLTVSLAEKTHIEKRPQKPHLLHNRHGHAAGALLPAASLPPAGVTERRRSSLRLRETGTFQAL